MPYQFTIADHKPADLDAMVATLRKQIGELQPNVPQLAHQGLGKQTGVKEALVVVRGHEDPHKHTENDLIIYVLEGGGYVQLFPGRIEAPEGSVVVIPKGVCHAYYNTSANDSVVIATFSPTTDKDPVPCKEK